MPIIDLNLDADGVWPDMRGKKIHRTVGPIHVAGLASGTESRLPSVAFRFNLDDGSCVFSETTLRLFLDVADMLKARHGDPR